MEQLTIGKVKITWLNGGRSHFDGGAIFGTTPKTVWKNYYEDEGDNLISLRTDPMLVQWEDSNVLIEVGVGSNRFTELQRHELNIQEEASLTEDLATLGLTPESIDGICLTYMHNDHVAGLVERVEDRYRSVFPNASIYMAAREWEEARYPNLRTDPLYREENWMTIEQQVVLFDHVQRVGPYIEMRWTGGHTAGHCLIVIESEGERAIHLGDLMPTYAHEKERWVSAFDDFPVDSVIVKDRIIKEEIPRHTHFIFYHDLYCRSVCWDMETHELVDVIERKDRPQVDELPHFDLDA